MRSTEILENLLKDAKSVQGLGVGERLTAEQITAGAVGDGQRVAVAAIGQHELALVISAPQIVRRGRP